MKVCKHNLFWLFLVLVIIVGAPVEATAEHQRNERPRTVTVNDRSQEMNLNLGDDLLKQGKYEDAIRVWRGGFRTSGHWLYYGRIGNCLHILGKNRLSLAYLERFLGDSEPWFVEEHGETIQNVINQVRRVLPTELEVGANRYHAAIYVDNRLVGHTPLEEPLVVIPGRHRIRAELPGFKSDPQEVDIAYGTRNYISFSLEPEASIDSTYEADNAPREESTQPDNGSNPQRRHLSRLWTLLFAGSGSALSGVGSWMIAMSQRANDKYYNGETGQDLTILGSGLLSVGLSLVCAGIVWLFMPPKRHFEEE